MRNKTKVILWCILSAVFLIDNNSSAQNFAVTTNILEWGCLSPNLEVALVTGEKSSVHLGTIYTNKPYNFDFKGLIFTPEYRYWFQGRPFSRLFVGAAADIVAYNRKGYEGRATAIGPTAGYDIVLGDKWSIDMYLGAGGAIYHQHLAESGNVKEGTNNGFTFAPIKAGISIVYIIK